MTEEDITEKEIEAARQQADMESNVIEPGDYELTSDPIKMRCPRCGEMISLDYFLKEHYCPTEGCEGRLDLYTTIIAL